MNQPDLHQTDNLDGLLGEVGDEILEQLARGEQPDIERYAEEHPQIASFIRRTFPALQLVGQSASEDGTAEGIDLSRSKQLGDFRLLRELGSGGMGYVYEAEQHSMGRHVALKILPMAGALQQTSLARFRNEVRAAGALDHPNVVSVYAVGEERGVHYYAMQLIRGQTLAEVIQELARLKTGNAPLTGNSISEVLSANDLAGVNRSVGQPMEEFSSEDAAAADEAAPATQPVAQGSISTLGQTGADAEFFRSAAHLGIQAADALQHAHDQGVLHRDIKPGNLMLDPDAHLYITDFGLARIEADAGMTMTGDLVGTLRYMSPEQALAKRIAIDHRSDIYSLGMTLYELLTLRPAFDAADRQEVLKQIAFQDPPKPCQINRSIPGELETIILKAIDKNPDERYATAAELADDLGAFLEDRPIKAKRPGLLGRSRKWSRRHRPLVWSAGVSSALLLVIAVVVLAISNAMIARERNEKTEALEARTTALGEKDEALATADANLKKALEAVDRMLTRVGEEELANVPQMGPVRQALLDDALEFYQSLLEQNREDAVLHFRTAQALRRVGEIYREHEHQLAKANQVLRHALLVLESCADEYPSEGDYLAELATTNNALGSLILWRLREDRQAEPFLQRAASLRRELAEKWPDEPEYRAAAGDHSVNLAELLERSGRHEEAIEILREGTALARELAHDFPDVQDYQKRYADVLRHFARHTGMDNPDKEEALLNEALAIQRVAYRDDRPNAWQVGFTHARLGNLLRGSGRLAEAEDVLRSGASLSESLVADFPSVTDNWRAHYTISINLARVLADQKKNKEAEQTYRGIWKSLQSGLTKAPSMCGRFLVVSREYVTFLKRGGRSLEEVKDTLETTVAVLESAVAQIMEKEVQYGKRAEPDSRKLWQSDSDDSTVEQSIISIQEEANLALIKARISLARFSGSTVDVAQIAGTFVPDTAGAFVDRGKLFDQYWDHDRALADYSRAIELDPNLAEAYRTRAWIYRNRNDHERALADSSTAIQLNPNCNNYHGRAQTYCAMRQYQKAIADETKAIELNPNVVDYYEVRAEAYRGLNEVEKERQDLVKAVRLNVTSAHAYLKRGKLHERLKQYDQALADYTRSLEIAPNHSQGYAYYRRGALYLFQFEQYDQALVDFDAVIQARFSEVIQARPNESAYLYKFRALTHFHLEHFEKALADIAKGVELNPVDLSNLSFIAPSLAAKCPDDSFRAGLLELVDRTIELTGGSASAYGRSAVVYAEFGRFDRARSDLRKSVDRERENAYASYQCALLSIMLDEPESYRDICRRMVDRFAESDDANDARWTAWTNALRPDVLENYDECIRLSKQALSGDDNSQHLNSLGAIFVRAGRYDDAVARLNEVVESWGDELPTSSSPAYTWFFLAMAEVKLGHTEEAQRWLAKALQQSEQELADEQLPWNRRATLELLRDEATALVSPDPTDE